MYFTQCAMAGEGLLLLQVWTCPYTLVEYLVIVAGLDCGTGQLVTKPWRLNLSNGEWTTAPMPYQQQLPNAVFEIPPRIQAASFRVSRDWLLIHGGCPPVVRFLAFIQTGLQINARYSCHMLIDVPTPGLKV